MAFPWAFPWALVGLVLGLRWACASACVSACASACVALTAQTREHAWAPLMAVMRNRRRDDSARNASIDNNATLVRERACASLWARAVRHAVRVAERRLRDSCGINSDNTGQFVFGLFLACLVLVYHMPNTG